MAGFIKIDRALLEWRWHDMPSAVSLWLHLLLKANWKDGFFMGEPVPRGSLATSYRHLSEETGINLKTVVKWISRFEEEGQIEVKSYSRFTLIKLINYAKFQDENFEGGTVTGTQSGTPNGTQHGTQDGTQTGTRNGTQSGTNRRRKEPKNIEGNNYNSRSASGKNYFNSYPVKIDAPQYFKDQQSGKLKQDDTPATAEQIANINELMSLMYRKVSEDE